MEIRKHSTVTGEKSNVILGKETINKIASWERKDSPDVVRSIFDRDLYNRVLTAKNKRV